MSDDKLGRLAKGSLVSRLFGSGKQPLRLVAVPRDHEKDQARGQRRLADCSGRRHHFRSEQEPERGGTGDEARADQSHHPFAGNAQRQRHGALRRDHPETHLADLLGD